MFCCVARYGYKDLHKKVNDFEKQLFNNLMFVRLDSMMEDVQILSSTVYMDNQRQSTEFKLKDDATTSLDPTILSVDSIVPASRSSMCGNNIGPSSLGKESSQTEGEELEFLGSCRDAGVVHIMENTAVRARRESGIRR